ncbi:effector-associated constant component EACC1 [Streptomyces sp. NPDC003635]
MDVQLRLPDDPDGGELKQLYDWLLAERQSGLDAEISLRNQLPRSDSDMGDAFDLIQLVVETVFQVASLGFIIVEFRRARRPRSHVVVERDGRRATLRPDASPEEVEEFLRELRDMDGPPDGTA